MARQDHNPVPTQGADRGLPPNSDFDWLGYAAEVLEAESHTLAQLAGRLDENFRRAVQLIRDCAGSVIVSGMGKAGLIGQKIAATLASTGTRSHVLHPAEALHGDLGRIHHDDVLLVLSQSGETEEIVRLLPSLARFGVSLVAITTSRASRLGRSATVTIELGPMREACRLGLAPTTSTTAMLAVGDALALVVSRLRGFQPEDFARFHPGGSLGLKLSRVDEQMRPLAECRVADQDLSVREVFVRCTRPGRRTGAIMLVDGQGRLSGLFTDSDLARLFERHGEADLDGPIHRLMSSSPTTVRTGTTMADAMRILSGRKFSELPVVDAAGRPVGLIDVTDIVGWTPQHAEQPLRRTA